MLSTSLSSLAAMCRTARWIWVLAAALWIGSGYVQAQSSSNNNPKRIKIEKLMREYQVRHFYTRGTYVVWPTVDGCSGTCTAPNYPPDGYYGDRVATDLNYAASLVDAVRIAFYSTDHRVYNYFVDNGTLDGVARSSSYLYTVDEVPLDYTDNQSQPISISTSATVTAANCTPVFNQLEKHVAKFTGVLATSAYDSVIDAQVKYANAVTQDTTFEDATEAAEDDWDSESFINVTWIFPQGMYTRLQQYWSVSCNTGHYIHYVDIASGRFKAKVDSSLYAASEKDNIDAEIDIYSDSIPRADGHYSSQPGSIPGDSTFSLYATESAGGIWQSETIGGTLPEFGDESPGPDCPTTSGGPLVIRGWLLNGMVSVVRPDFALVVRKKAKGPGCENGCSKQSCIIGGSSADAGSLLYRVSLGSVTGDESAGYLSIHEDLSHPDLAKRSKIVVVKTSDVSRVDETINEEVATSVYENHVYLRQLKAPQGLVDLQVDGSNAYKYYIRFYAPGDYGTTKVSGLYPITGTAYRTITVENPDFTPNPSNHPDIPGTYDKVRITETEGASSLVYQFEWDAGDARWDLREGYDPVGGDAIVCHGKTKLPGVTGTEVYEVRDNDSSGTLRERETVTYSQFDWGVEVTARTSGSGADEKTQEWEYYDDEGGDGVNYGNLKSYTNEDGYEETYTYDIEGYLARTQSTTRRVDITTEMAQLDADELDLKKTFVEKEPDGSGGWTEVRRWYEVTWGDPETFASKDCYVVSSIECVSTGDAWNASTNLVTRTGKYAEGTHIYETAFVDHPDGTRTEYKYPSSTVDEVYSGYFSGGSLVEGTKVVRTLTTTTRFLKKVETYGIKWGGSYVKFDEQEMADSNDLDIYGRVLHVTYLDGTTSETEYGCCGVISTIDRQGLETTYEYDELGRTKIVTRALGTSAEVRIWTVYDAAGRVVETKRQVPGGSWTTIATAAYDTLGRVTRQTDIAGKSTYYTYGTSSTGGYDETRVYPDAKALGPIQVTWTDSEGHTVRSFLATTSSADWSPTEPAGTETLVEASRTAYTYDALGRQDAERMYYSLASLGLADQGTEGTHYNESKILAYDGMGRVLRTRDAVGTISATVYDSVGRATEQYMGTDATGATASDPTNSGSGGNNMALVSEVFYDTDRDNTGDPTERVTRAKQLKAAGSLTYSYVDMEYDEAGRQIWAKPESGSGGAPWTKTEYDNGGRVTDVTTYQNGSVSYILGKSSSTYDGVKRLSASRVREVNGSGALTGNYVETTYAYDDASRTAKVATAGRGFYKTEYDELGRVLRSVTCSAEGTDTTATDFDDDIVLTETVSSFNDLDQTIQTTTYVRNHDTSGSHDGLLSDDASKARLNYTAVWYDDAHRPTHAADYGTNGGSSFTRPGTAPEPNASDNILVTKTVYDSLGRQQQTIDNKALVTWNAYDALGRVVTTQENYTGGGSSEATPTGSDNRTTRYTYTADGQIKTLTADMPTGTNDQVTRYVYSGELTDKGSPVASNSYLRAVIYPDSDDTVTSNALSDGAATYDRVEMTYLANGAPATRKDQRGIVLTFAYDLAGRRTSQSVTTGTVGGDQRIGYAYTDVGQLDTVTTYSDSSGTTVTGQVKHAYNGMGQLITEYQDHSSTVATGGGSPSPKVQYAYDTTVSSSVFTKAMRPTKITYPNGREVYQLYADTGDSAGLSDAVSRVTALSTASTRGSSDVNVIASYDAMGDGRTVMKSYPTPEVRLDHFGGTTGTYAGLDRFGRNTDHRWVKDYSGTPADLFRLQHAYDRNSNRLYADNQVYKGSSNVYSYDNLNRLTQYKSGLINSGKTDTQSHWTLNGQKWTYNHLGSPTQVEQWQEAAFVAWTQGTFNDANEYVTRKVRGDKRTPVHHDDFNSNTTAVNFDLPGGATDTFSVNPGGSAGYFVVDTVVADTFSGNTEEEARGIYLYGSSMSVCQLMDAAYIVFPGSTGQAGFVFGYKHANDYWIIVQDKSDTKARIYHVVDGVKSLFVASSSASYSSLIGRSRSSLGHAVSWFTNFSDGLPSGRVGFYSNTANVKFAAMRAYTSVETCDLSSRWTSNARSFGTENWPSIDTSTDSLRLGANLMPGPILLKNFVGRRFEMTFAVKLITAQNEGRLRVAFNARPDTDDYDFMGIYFRTSTKAAPNAWKIENGQYPVAVTATTDINDVWATSSQVGWARITSDGTTVTLKCIGKNSGDPAPSDSDWTGQDAALTTTNFDCSEGGMIGFESNHDVPALIDDITLKSDTDANGSYETTELVETFTADGSGYVEDTLTHDLAGNLTYDGVSRYVYDAWNRLIKVTRAGIDASTPGATIQESRYDGKNRRIVTAVQNSGVLNATYHDYYTSSWQLIETRNGSDLVIKQALWAPGSVGYVDELVQVAINDDPTDTEQDCETFYWAMQDANFNVLGLVESDGDLKERYEYTPYGQRTVFTSVGSNDPGSAPGSLLTPSQTAPRLTLSSVRQPYGICDQGHQGLGHDAAIGMIDNRRRIMLPGMERFAQRDPLGYVDGKNSKEYVQSNPVKSVDPEGLKLWQTDIVVKSFIRRIGAFIGHIPGGSQRLLDVFGIITDGSYNENPLTDDKSDRKYRLFTRETVEFECCGDQIVPGTAKKVRDSRVGREPEFPVQGLSPPPGIFFNDSFVTYNGGSFGIIEWTFKGRPHPSAEPLFTAVGPRTSVYIWHEVRVKFGCKDDKGWHSIQHFAGSRFPSHRLWINGGRAVRNINRSSRDLRG